MKSCFLSTLVVFGCLSFTQVAYAQAPVIAKGLSPEGKNENADETRVSDFLGTEIVSEKGDSFGVVKDLIISRSTDTVQYVIVASDDSDYRAIPWKTLASYQGSDPKDRYFILGMEKELYNKAPVLAQEEWSSFSTPTWSTYAPQVNKYYSNVRPVTPGEVRRDRRQERRNIP